MKKILLSTLRFFAKKTIKKYHPQVIGITGSVGKTSAKEAIALVLATSVLSNNADTFSRVDFEIHTL
jgi:UDP-N-acetylmuramyl pentapeptide synthase